MIGHLRIQRLPCLHGALMLATTLSLLPVDPGRADSVLGNDPLEVNVLVLNFDPTVPGGSSTKIRQLAGWNDPHVLAQNHIQYIDSLSGGFIHYNIANWVDIDGFPIKTDGFQYTKEEYVQNLVGPANWHSPDGMDYPRMLSDHGAVDLVNAGTVDEVWFFGGPYFGYWESAMAGPDAFYINGGVYPGVASNRPFAIMGFNYERGDAELLHSLEHRFESSIARVFGGWNIHQPQTEWDRFTANAGQTLTGPNGVGSIHFPANGLADYDYGNSTAVLSTAEDWLRYPSLTGTTELVSAADWGGDHLGYMRFWFEHLPKAEGLNSDTGRVNNWWKYAYDWTSYHADGTVAVPEVPSGLLTSIGILAAFAISWRRHRASPA